MKASPFPEKNHPLNHNLLGSVFMIIIAVIVIIVVSFLGSWIIGILGASVNRPDAGAIFAVVTMRAFTLYVIIKKDK